MTKEKLNTVEYVGGYYKCLRCAGRGVTHTCDYRAPDICELCEGSGRVCAVNNDRNDKGE